MVRLSFTLALTLALGSAAAAQAACHAAAERQAPLLSEVAEGRADAEAVLAGYVCAYQPGSLGSTADLLRALALRDSVIAQLSPRVEAWFFADEAQRYEQLEAFVAEAEALALRPVMAEGMLFGLTTGPLLDGLATVLASPDLAHYLDFTTAEGEGAGGEYPFAWLDPEVRMVLAGEALRRDFPASPYVGRTQEAFGRALLTLASLHHVRAEGFDGPQWFAGVGTSEFYPWAAEGESLQAFVRMAGDAGSRYAAPFASLLADPSEAASGDTLSVVVVGDAWGSREDAEARALSLLDAGHSVAGPLVVDEGTVWVAYRYYPVGDPRAQAAHDRAEAAGLRPRLITHSPEVY